MTLHEHYIKIKSREPGTVALFNMGNKYILIQEDAQKCSPVLGIEIRMTRREGFPEPVPTISFDRNELETRLPKLVRNGFRVAIVEGAEAGKLAAIAHMAFHYRADGGSVVVAYGRLDVEGNNCAAMNNRNFAHEVYTVDGGEWLPERPDKALFRLRKAEYFSFGKTTSGHQFEAKADDKEIACEWAATPDEAVELLSAYIPESATKVEQ